MQYTDFFFKKIDQRDQKISGYGDPENIFHIWE